MSQEEKNKKAVDLAKKTLLSLGYDVKTTHLYEMFAKLSGYNSWAVAKSKNVDILSKIQNIFNHDLEEDPSSSDELRFIKNFESQFIRSKFIENFYFGVFENNKDYIVNFEKAPNALYAGSMGVGKTISLINSLLIYMANNSKNTSLFIVDLLKGAKEYSAFFEKNNDGKNKYSQIADNINSIEKFNLLINGLYDEHNKRCELFEKYSSGKISEFEKKSGNKINRCLIVIEEIHHIFKTLDFKNNYKVEDSIANKFWILLRAGRITGISFIGVSQQATSLDIPPEIVSCFLNKLVFRISSTEASYLIGKSEISKLLYSEKGRCFSHEASDLILNCPKVFMDNPDKYSKILLNKYMKNNIGKLLSTILKEIF